MIEPNVRDRVTDALLALLPDAITRWDESDPVLARLARNHPPPARPLTTGDAFHALVTSIAHQQVSLAAGKAIMLRVEAALGGRVTPDAALAAGEDALRAAGLSRPKVRYVLDLADKTARGEVALDRLRDEPDAAVVDALTSVKGIGTWTAKMFLLFHMDRPDVVAHEDLGLVIAVADAYDVPREDAAARMRELAPAWSPYASVAALVLWNWRRIIMEEKRA